MKFSNGLKFALATALVTVFFLPASVRGQDTPEALYKAKCATCHGAHGAGDTDKGKKTRARDFGSAEVQNETDAQFIEIIANGKNMMPGYKKRLTDTQIKDLAAHCREMGNKK